jgi:hypothetical protein
MIGFLVLYTGVLVLLGMIQFSSRGSFTRQVGNLVVTGHYRSQDNLNRYVLFGDPKVSFGGMEFSITSKNNGFGLIRSNGKKEYILPEYMLIADKTLTFGIPGGTELVFISQYDEQPELMIYAILGEDTVSLELPYKPLKGSKIQKQDNGELVILTNGLTYHFNRFLTEEETSERQVLILEAPRSFISYRAVVEVPEQAFDFKDFILSAAQDKQNYDKAIARWRDQSFSQWSKSISSSNNEDLVVAYVGESISRGTYSTAVGAVPSLFLNGNRRTYVSTVFLGRLDMGLRSLAAAERDKQNRLSQLIAQQSLEFLKEPHVFEYFAVRGSLNLIDEGAKLIRAFDPMSISPDLISEILEGYSDWNLYRSTMEQTKTPENPFEGFLNQVSLLIAQGIKKVAGGGDKVFMFDQNMTDIEFNLRLGKALMIYAEGAGSSDWAAIGRSLVLSVIALVTESDTISARFHLSEMGTITEDPTAPRLSSAQIYRILSPGENYPHGVNIGGPGSDIWTWTGASSLSISQENNGLDLAVSFPIGETHYMLIRGIAPPNRIQLYNMDYRTAPDFERYNSSGWSYSASERTLLVKMRHRSPVEHVKIFY